MRLAFGRSSQSPVPTSIGLPLTEGLTSDAVCTENRIKEIIPLKLLSCREAIRLALDRVEQEQIETCWLDAGELIEPEWAHCGDAEWAGGTILDVGYRLRINASADEVWRPVGKIGGRNGWYFMNPLWRLRGFLDRLVGGVGLKRGRRHPTELMVGDALDFWRVLKVEPPRRLLLLAEMRAPGEALLDFQIKSGGNDQIELQLLSRFLPKGLLGILYWYAMYPLHAWLFAGMLRSIASSIGKPVAAGPQRFTSETDASCLLP